MKQRIKEVTAVVSELAWRGFGVLLYIIGGSGTMGAIITGNWLSGVFIAWGTLMLGIVGVLGYAIATTGKATREDVAKGAKDAVQKAEGNRKNGA
jgi:hypothetical protein